jgi:mRNA interferase RelE/StbE
MSNAPSAYRLQFLPQAKQEWDKLDGSVRAQFAKVLLRRLDDPRVPAAALTSMPDCYKIKLRSTGFRMVYQVQDDVLVLLTVAVGKRDKSAVYNAAKLRLSSEPEPSLPQSVGQGSAKPRARK